MANRQSRFWEGFFSPVVRLLLDEESVQRYAEIVDWDKESDRFRRSDVVIPRYYSNHNFHGVNRGYLNPVAAITYDLMTQYVFPFHETLVRQALISAIKVQPRRILDLGCGTGSTTLMLKQAFPDADVTGLDLSTYMLIRAEHKAQNAGLDISWRHGDAEHTRLTSGSFDLVTACLLFHETPADVSQAILHESFRLLAPGGQVLVLDGNQKTLREVDWLNNVFEEPYIREYAAFSVDAIMGAAGFGKVLTRDVFWMNQVTSGFKPIVAEDADTKRSVRHYNPRLKDIKTEDLQGFPSPAFDTMP